MRLRLPISLMLALGALVLIGAAPAFAQAPVNTIPPTISGLPNVGMDLTMDPGGWTGDRPVTFSQQWLRCDARGDDCADIAGATNQTYRPVLADAGATIAVRVLGTNGSGSASAVSRATDAVLRAPTISDRFASDIGPTTLNVIAVVNPHGLTTSCTVDYGLTDLYGSTADCSGTLTDTAGDMSAPLASLFPDARYHFRVTASNADGATRTEDATFLTSFALPPTITATQPTFISQTLAVAHAFVMPNGFELLSCRIEWGATLIYDHRIPCDPMPDLNIITGTLDETATLSGLKPDTEYHYRVLAENFALRSSPDVTFRTPPVTAPVNTAAPTILGDPTVAVAASVEKGRWSGGGTQTFAYQWLRCDAAGQGCAGISGATGSTYKPVLADAGNTLAVRVTATNAVGSGTAVSAPTSVVLAPPTIGLVSATIVGSTTANVTGQINPNGKTTTCRVEYGLTTAYGSSVACNGTLSGTTTKLSLALLESLTPSTTYHFRLIATNADGRTFSGDRMFRTAAPA
jgi:hypothetical protein